MSCVTAEDSRGWILAVIRVRDSVESDCSNRAIANSVVAAISRQRLLMPLNHTESVSICALNCRIKRHGHNSLPLVGGDFMETNQVVQAMKIGSDSHLAPKTTQ